MILTIYLDDQPHSATIVAAAYIKLANDATNRRIVTITVNPIVQASILKNRYTLWSFRGESAESPLAKAIEVLTRNTVEDYLFGSRSVPRNQMVVTVTELPGGDILHSTTV